MLWALAVLRVSQATVCTGCARLRVGQRERVGEDRGNRLAAREHERVEEARGERGDVGVAALRRGGHAAAHERLELLEQLGLGGERGIGLGLRVGMRVGVRERVGVRVRVTFAGRKASRPSNCRSPGTSSAMSGAAMHFIHVHCSATSSTARASEMGSPKRTSCSI